MLARVTDAEGALWRGCVRLRIGVCAEAGGYGAGTPGCGGAVGTGYYSSDGDVGPVAVASYGVVACGAAEQGL